MRGLPGEDRAVNNITETHLRQLFDTGHGKAGAGDTALQEAGADSEGEGEEGRGGRAVTLEDKLGRVQGAAVAPGTDSRQSPVLYPPYPPSPLLQTPRPAARSTGGASTAAGI